MLCGAGEWLLEKLGTRMRPGWRTLHIGTDADTGRIVAATLTGSDACDVSQVGPLLDPVPGPIASFTAEGVPDWDSVYDKVAACHPGAAVLLPPRASTVPSSAIKTALTQHDRQLLHVTNRDHIDWQAASGYNWRALVNADGSRFKRVIGDALRSRTDYVRIA